MISFKKLILIFYTQVSNTTLEINMKKEAKANITLILLLGVWPKKNVYWIYSEYTGAFFLFS